LSSRIILARLLLLLLLPLITLTGCTALPPPAGEVTQISTYPALASGLYDGDVTYDQLGRAGNFGIGTFDGMDGEMVAVDGQFFQARSDGSVRIAANNLESPFATVTYFVPEQRFQAAGPFASYDELKAYLTKAVVPGNRPFAIRVDGKFKRLKIRSIPAQSQPYPPLADVIAEQTTWEHDDIDGTLVGYWFPDYLSTLNAPGYHLHFISQDRQVAGHVLELSLESGTIGIDKLDRVLLRIPGTESYAAADLSAKQ